MDSGMGKHYCRDRLCVVTWPGNRRVERIFLAVWYVDVCESGQVITASSLMVAWPDTLCSSIINFQYRNKPNNLPPSYIGPNSSHHTPRVISEDIIQALTLHVTHNPCDPPRHYGLSRHHVTSEILGFLTIGSNTTCYSVQRIRPGPRYYRQITKQAHKYISFEDISIPYFNPEHN